MPRAHARAGQGRRCARLERPPGAIERRDSQHPGKVQPERDEDDATELPKDRQVVDKRPREVGRGDPEQGEDAAEPGYERERVADCQPARRIALGPPNGTSPPSTRPIVCSV